MTTRRIFAQPEDIIEIIAPSGASALKVRVLTGTRGNLQVLTYPQPGTRFHIEPRQADLPVILADDPTDTEF